MKTVIDLKTGKTTVIDKARLPDEFVKEIVKIIKNREQ